MEQTILTPAQEQAIAAVAGEARLADFYLSGGTALAEYYLRHRISDDLDFFTYNDPDSIFLHEFTDRLKGVLRAESVRFERLHDRNQFHFILPGQAELKVEFTRYHFELLEKLQIQNGLRLDSLRDISANKLMALIDRFDPKDFVDLFFILQQASLEQVRKDAEKKFGISIDGIFLGGEMGKVRRVEALPKMLKPLKLDELKAFFTEQAKKLSPEILA